MTLKENNCSTSYLQVCHGLCTGRPPRPDLDLERQVQGALRGAIRHGLVSAAHDLSDGGLLVAVAEMAISAGCGAQLELAVSELRLERLLFAEGGARIVVSVSPERLEALQAYLLEEGCSSQWLGTVQQDPKLVVRQGEINLLDQTLASLHDAHGQGLPRRLGHNG